MDKIEKIEKIEKWARMAMPQSKFENAIKEFGEYYSVNFEGLQAAEKAFRNLALLLLKGSNNFPEPKVTSRIKSSKECIRKFDGKYRKDLEDSGEDYSIREKITDLLGVRIVCLYESDIAMVEKVLISEFELIEKTDKTREIESSDSEFGYKGVHLDLKLNDIRKNLPEYRAFQDQGFEVQIRTIVQDAWSEVDHKLKYKNEIPSVLRRRIFRLAALFELSDQEFEAIRDKSIEFEKQAKTKSFDESASKLDVFGFKRVVEEMFENYSFYGETLAHLLGQILSTKSDITVAEFRNALENNIAEIIRYKEHMAANKNKMNAYTQIRHCLYRSDKTIYRDMIFDSHRTNFDRFEEHGTIHPNEIPHLNSK